MNFRKLLFVIITLSITVSCSITSKQKQGTVSPKNFSSKIEFTIFKSLIIIPAVIDSESRNFIFDTGSQLTVVQSDSISGKTISVDGASGRKSKMGIGVVKSITIGDVGFKSTYAANQDFTGLKELIPKFGGLIGQSIIQKANWLIDYPNRTMNISNKDLSDNTFTSIKIDRKDGSPFTFINIDGKKYEAIIDLGSTRSLSIPKNSKLAENLKKTYSFENVDRKNYTIGDGIKTSTQKVGHLALVKLGGIENKEVETVIKRTSSIRIGSGFFKNYLIYIDNDNGSYKIKKGN